MWYLVVTLWQKLWDVLLALMALGGILYAFWRDPIRPRDIVSHKFHPFRKKKPLYLCALVVLIACIAVNCLEIPLSGTATISLNYDGASRGLNPNSTRFNQADMLSDEILERVIQLGRFDNIDADDLKDVIEIVPVEKGSSSDGSYRVSTEYKVKYRADGKFAQEDAEEILQLYCGCYKEWFKGQYSYNMDSLEIDFESIAQEDYLDMCDYFDKTADRIHAFMSSMARKEAMFESTSAGETFQTVGTRAENVKSSLIQDLRAYLLDAGIAKDAATYKGRLAVANVFLMFEAYKHRSSNENRLSAITKYANDMARIVLIPTYDMDGQFYMSQTKIGIDNFAEDAEDFAKKKTSVDADIAENNYIYGQLNNRTPSEAEIQKAEALIQVIEDELSDIASDARAAVKEYDDKQTNGYLSYSVTKNDDRIKSAVEDAAFSAFLFLIVSLADLFVLEVKRDRKRGADAK